jgi:hypothetical protein
MLQRSLITATCMLAFAALTSSTATALVTAPINPGGGTQTCSSSCSASDMADCTGGTWTQSNYKAGPPPSATESCTSPANAVSCTVTGTSNNYSSGSTAANQTGAKQLAGCFAQKLATNKVTCTSVTCGARQQFCITLSYPSGAAYCTQ